MAERAILDLHIHAASPTVRTRYTPHIICTTTHAAPCCVQVLVPANVLSDASLMLVVDLGTLDVRSDVAHMQRMRLLSMAASGAAAAAAPLAAPEDSRLSISSTRTTRVVHASSHASLDCSESVAATKGHTSRVVGHYKHYYDTYLVSVTSMRAMLCMAGRRNYMHWYSGAKRTPWSAPSTRYRLCLCYCTINCGRH